MWVVVSTLRGGAVQDGAPGFRSAASKCRSFDSLRSLRMTMLCNAAQDGKWFR